MTYDTIIVGAGSAGCVLANRLSANPNRRVLLLEAGPRDWHPFIHMPAGIAKLVGKKGINWNYSTEPELQLCNRRLWWPRGKVLGGSSSINAMCYIRGDARDYDEWARLIGDEKNIGSVAPGRYADLVGIRGDPLADISLVRSVSFVMKGGVVVREP